VTNTMYVPPTFPIYEFDDTELPLTSPVSRWLPSWQGEVGKPAEEVCLGWFDNDRRQIVVLTTKLPEIDVTRELDSQEARYSTARIVLAGNQIVENRPTDPSKVSAMMDEIASGEWPWASQDFSVNGVMRPGRVTQITDRIMGGFVHDAGQLICFAGSSSLFEGVKLRAVATSESGRLYSTDPTSSHEISKFETQQGPTRVWSRR